MTSRPLVILGVIIILIAVIAASGYILNSSPVPAPVQTPDSGPDSASTTPLSGQIPLSATSTLGSVLYVPPPATSTADIASWKMYVDNKNGFSIEYPPNMVQSTASGALSLAFPKSTYFSWPLLDDAKVTVSVASTCPPIQSGGLDGNPADKTTFTVNGNELVRTVGSDVGAGNLYTEIAYDAVSGGVCYHIYFLDHGTNGAGFYVSDAYLVKKYDSEHAAHMQAVLKILSQMVGSFRLLAR